MIQKTRGLVLSYIKYRETSLIVKIYTEEYGLQTYMVNGVRSTKSSKSKIAFFQPLSLVDLIVNYKEGNSINYINEIKFEYIYNTVPYQHKKCVIAIFLAEILQKTIKENHGNRALFDFLYNSLITLDKQKDGIENFHLIFMLKYALFLGFAPSNAIQFFNEVNSVYSEFELSTVDMFLNSLNFEVNHKIENSTRRFLLEKVIYLYQINIESIGLIKSIDVLREIMD